MTEESKICEKKILDNDISKEKFYMIKLLFNIFVAILFITIIFAEGCAVTSKYRYMRSCQKEGNSQEKCETLWHELELID